MAFVSEPTDVSVNLSHCPVIGGQQFDDVHEQTD